MTQEPTTRPAAQQAERRRPRRTCVGCGEADARQAMVRLVGSTDGDVVVDYAGGAFGRGAWLHPRVGCVERATAGRVARVLRTPVKTSPAVVAERLRAAASRRVAGLLGAAARSKKLVVGADAVNRALDSDEAELVVVASDARAAANEARVQRAVAEGRGVAWGSKQAIGAALGRPDVGVVAVLDGGLAGAIREAVASSQIPNPREGGRTKR